MFKLFKRKKEVSEEIEIDEKDVKQAKVPKKNVLEDYKNYSNKSIEWLKKHLEVISDIVNNKKFGTKNKATIEVDGRRFYKDENIKPIFNGMLDDYSSYYYTLKRYVDVRKELERISEEEKKEFLAAGKHNELRNESNYLEKELNRYFSRINNAKKTIKHKVYNR